ncbi:ABC transporter ATP-binding protein [Rhodoplanes sp. SY1]|uniref:ABC transporter ATP-binding protein n=1 Tax=Rhodoplanes sp. SY1 TaxID=3166646 RepID=UPI0038B5729B
MYTEKARLLHDVVLWAMAGGMLTWAVNSWIAGRITPGDVVVVSALTFRILHGSRDMALALVDMVQQFGAIEDTLGVIGRRQDVRDRPGAPALPHASGGLRFERVRFGYGRGGRAVLHDVDVDIPPGQTVGIVGPSGAGKSTFVALLQRLHDIDAGAILIDGTPIADVSQESLRANLAVVPQEVTLFHRSVRDNIRFGRPDASDAEVLAAAKAAQCDGFVRGLSIGYDTVVGERGLKLSGGQRNGIARALLKKVPILILDEATSALDTQSEIAVHREILRAMAGRTVIAVAHRLSTLASFDRVLVMIDGRIVEDGTPADLRRRGGAFAQMWHLQAEGLWHDNDEAAGGLSAPERVHGGASRSGGSVNGRGTPIHSDIGRDASA